MSDAAGERTHRVHFLGLTQLYFGNVSPLFGVIAFKMANEQFGKRFQKIFLFFTKRIRRTQRAFFSYTQ